MLDALILTVKQSTCRCVPWQPGRAIRERVIVGVGALAVGVF